MIPDYAREVMVEDVETRNRRTAEQLMDLANRIRTARTVSCDGRLNEPRWLTPMRRSQIAFLAADLGLAIGGRS